MKTAIVSRRSVQAFTLVELLTVIAIIGLLVGLLLPGIMAVREASRRARARTEVSAIQHALKLYYNEYTKWPTNLYANDTDPAIETIVSTNGLVITNTTLAMLAGQKNINGANPRLKVLMDMPNNDPFLDPWGNSYKYMCDYNYDNMLSIKFSAGPSVVLTNVGVAVWSRGRDRNDDQSHQKDDIRTWQ